ncbi:TolC family outer membrane protein [Pseudomonas sp. CBSPBW29]|uniref:TolC family outer membrane protein n=1 Tax=unclassified Pseudomonas TaxID=196821 RepID=UPI0021ABA80F|nr:MULTISPECIES: TolC family outer membrane protein [unclassified Pseudomonas]WEL41311.1 TolC family outer membrane protein [Pseudomonas sp. CBSPBW29]WEL62372.1 TolC family outer membrane protein [Pseudomonas sp. CBSPGW29]WEL71564.1 TolC family outer membrane protein [Pseudomonas sp. CBSPCGW29]WEL82891.1 TolC family outer membrane protein [Pseudomonas sp. CBSPCAW29]WEL85774.1 TolC family outer membrane protein [Pseudomonas sp. CBSPCBW29]
MKALVFSLCCACSGSVQALGLLDAYDLALRNDPTFQAAIQEREAGEENRIIGRAGLLPNLSWSYNNSRNESEVTQSTAVGNVTSDRDYRSYASTLTLQQPLLDYEAYARYRQGAAQALFADERFRGRSQELAVRVLSAYSQALLAQERIELSRAQKRAYAERLQLNERLLKGGEGTRTDVLETQARLSLAQAEEIESLDTQDAALRELEAIVGEPLQIEELAPLTRQFDIPPLEPNRFETWRDLAMANNPELKSQHHALDAAEYEVERKRAGHMPKVSLYASSRQTSSDSESSYNQKYDTNSVGIQVSLPLFAGGSVSASTRQAANQLSQAQYELDAQTAKTLIELRKQFNLNTSGAAKVRAYEMAVSSATALVTATKKSVTGGERVNLDVLDAEQQLFTARRDLADARHAYLLARIQLKYFAGLLNEQDLRALAGYFQPSA